MTIPDRIATALAAVLRDSSLPGSPSVRSGVSLAELTEEREIIIVQGITATLRKPTLAGNYDVSGEVTVKRVIFTEDGETAEQALNAFSALCKAVEGVVGQKYQLCTLLPIKQPALKVYSWNHVGQDTHPQDHRLLARYQWMAVASHDPDNPN